MFCEHCGTDVGDGKFCPNCGQPTNQDIIEKVTHSAEDVFKKTEEELKNSIQDVAGAAQSHSENSTSGSYNASYNYNENNSYNNNNNHGYNYVQAPLQTDRSLVTYILLTLITCGIYGYYFIYKIAADVNVACSGDGKNTGGLVQFILLSFITCGIYAWIWYYSLGNRLSENAPRYGLVFQENGTTILLWLIFGSIICGIGQFVAMHILIKNTNAICVAYNSQNGFYN